MTKTRRQVLVMGGNIAALMAVNAPIALAAGAKKLSFGVGLKALNGSVINCVIGEVLGYNAQEEFSLDVQALGTNSNAQVATDRGTDNIGIGVASTMLPILAKGDWQGAKM